MLFSEDTVRFLSERLLVSGITTAVVVDDAFDPPTLSSLQVELTDFWDGVEHDTVLREELEVLGIAAEFEEDINEEAMEALWSRREESTLLVSHANRTLFPNARNALEDIERLVAFLQELGLKVYRVGLTYPEPLPVAGLVFMDYLLDDSLPVDSPQLSTHKARGIYNAVGEGADKPFIILMSSLPGVIARAEKFREESDLLGGLFDVVPKDALSDPTQFAVRMAGWAYNMPLRHKIQNFVEALDSTLRDKTQDFMRGAKALTIEDYAFLQSLSLQQDGQPLGDYVQWLFSSLLVNKVLEKNEDFLASKNDINELSFDSQPLSQMFPSNQLAEVYSIAIAEQELEDVSRHPRVAKGERKEGGGAELECTVEDTEPSEQANLQKELPLLKLGDLLVNTDGKKVYMIVNPDCDLQFAPGERKLDGATSVLLIPGKLSPLKERLEGGNHMRTELYLHEGEKKRIMWDRTRISTVAIGKFFDWCSREGYSRTARMRLPYALKIQQEMIAGISRVGMPVAPPLQESIPVEIRCESVDGAWEVLGPKVESGVTVIHRDGGEPSFLVTPIALNEILRRCDQIKESYAELRKAAGGNKKAQLQKKYDNLNRCLAQPEKLALMLEKKHKLPRPGKEQQVMGDTIVLHRSGVCSDSCRNRHVVCLNILYD